MKNIITRFAGLFGLFSLLSLPFVAHSQSMQEFLQSSYDNHPELLYQVQRLHQSYEQSYGVAVAGILPTLNYTYTSSYTRSDQATVGTGQNAVSGTGIARTKVDRWRITQNLFSSFSDYFELREFLDRAHALKMSYYASEQEFMFNAITTYLNVIRADNVVRVRRANIASLTERMDIVQRLYSVGDATELDLRQSGSQLLTAQSNLEDALAQYDSALAAFRQFSALEAEQNSMAIPDVPNNIPASLAEGEEAVITNNFSLRAAEAFEKAGKQAYRATLGRGGSRTGIVDVNLIVDYEQTRTNQGLRNVLSTARVGNTDNITSAVSVNVPLYDPTHAPTIRRSHKAYLEAKSNYVRQRLANVQNVQAGWATYDRLTRSVELRRQAVESAQIALENVVLQQRAGLRTIVEVLDEETRLIQAQVSYEDARYNYLRSAYSLLSLTGRLTAKDLGLQASYGEQLEKDFQKKKYAGSLPGVVTAVQNLGGELFAD